MWVAFLEDIWGIRFKYHQVHKLFSISVNFLIDVCHRVLVFPEGCRLWFLSHMSWDVNWFSKQSAVTLTFSFGWYVIPKGPWTVVGAFGPSLFISDFTVGHRTCGVTSHSLPFLSHRSSAFIWVIPLMAFTTQLTAILHAGSRVTCHSFLSHLSCFNRLSGPGVTWSSKWKTVGRWSESRVSETMICDSQTFLCTTITSTSPFPAGE
jgi:hypothetical protein